MSSTIALFASSRRNGNTGRLMDEVAERLDIDIVDLTEKDISAYDYEHRNRNDDFEGLMARVLRHEQIIFASPVYWYAVSPPMKVFLDRISDLLDLPDLLEKGRQLRMKQAYVLCTSVYDKAPEPFIGAFRDTFGYLGMPFGGYLHANCQDGYKNELYQSDIAVFVERIKSGANAMTHVISGTCHCRNLSFELATRTPPGELRARACDCRFCRIHAAKNWSDPDGSVILRIADKRNTQKYRFALRTADFYICRICGAYLAAVLSDDEGTWSTVNLRLSELSVNEEPASYGAEDEIGRINRRKRVWTPTTIVPGA